MGGHGVEQRRRWVAVRCYRLAQDGMTTRQIAAALSLPPERIAGLVHHGQRINDLPAFQTGAVSAPTPGTTDGDVPAESRG